MSVGKKELLCSKRRKRVLYHIFRRPAKTVIKDIEKRHLSKLLGVGELTITRYLDGQLPSVKYVVVIPKVYWYNKRTIRKRM